MLSRTATSSTIRIQRDRAYGRADRATDPALRASHLHDAARYDAELLRRELESGRLF